MSKIGTKSSIPPQIRKNCCRAFDGLSYLAYKILIKIMFSYISIHILQMPLFGSEYLPIAGKKVNTKYSLLKRDN